MSYTAKGTDHCIGLLITGAYPMGPTADTSVAALTVGKDIRHESDDSAVKTPIFELLLTSTQAAAIFLPRQFSCLPLGIFQRLITNQR